jgi:hypothetical protein
MGKRGLSRKEQEELKKKEEEEAAAHVCPSLSIREHNIVNLSFFRSSRNLSKLSKNRAVRPSAKFG